MPPSPPDPTLSSCEAEELLKFIQARESPPRPLLTLLNRVCNLILNLEYKIDGLEAEVRRLEELVQARASIAYQLIKQGMGGKKVCDFDAIPKAAASLGLDEDSFVRIMAGVE